MSFRLKEVRITKGISQEELEKTSGISRQTISAIENKKDVNVQIDTLVSLAKALDVKVTDIFFDDSV